MTRTHPKIAWLVIATCLHPLLVGGMRAEESATAVRQSLEELGVKVSEMDGQYGVSFSRSEITAGHLKLLRQLPRLRHIHAFRTSNTDALVEYAGGIAELRTVNFLRSDVSPDCLQRLGKLEQLEQLGLAGTDINDDGLIHLGNFPKLRELDLSYTRTTDRSWKLLSKMKKLESLNLGYTCIDDSGAKHLGQIKSLRHLDLTGGFLFRITDKSLDYLSKLSNLELLVLRNNYVSDEGLALLSDLPKLNALLVAYTRITSKSIDSLAEMKKLRFLDVRGTGVSKPALSQLKTRLPLTRLVDDRSTLVGVAGWARFGMDVHWETARLPAGSSSQVPQASAVSRQATTSGVTDIQAPAVEPVPGSLIPSIPKATPLPRREGPHLPKFSTPTEIRRIPRRAIKAPFASKPDVTIEAAKKEGAK